MNIKYGILLLSAVALATKAELTATPHLPKPVAEFQRSTEAKPEQRLKQPTTENPTQTQFSLAELKQNPALTEHLLNLALVRKNPELIEKLLKIYRTFAQQDKILVQFAEALLAQNRGDLTTSIAIYQQILSQRADLNPIRIELARVMFENYQYQQAKNLLQQAKQDPDLPPDVAQYIQAYLAAIEKRQAWQWDFSAYYAREENVNKAASSPIIDNPYLKGLRKNPSMLPQKAEGVGYNVDLSKQSNITGQHFLLFENNLNGRFFWKNRQYSDQTNRTSLGYVHKSAVQTSKILPFYERSWYEEKRYSESVGLRLEQSRWFNENWQLSLSGEWNNNRYDQSDNADQNGKSYALSSTLFWLHNARQSFSVGFDWDKRKTTAPQYEYHTLRLRLNWNDSWFDNIRSRLSLSVSRRQYENEAKIGAIPLGKIRRDNIYRATLTLWKEDWHWKNIVPKLQISWQKRNSNLPTLYSYQETNANILFEKRF